MYSYIFSSKAILAVLQVRLSNKISAQTNTLNNKQMSEQLHKLKVLTLVL